MSDATAVTIFGMVMIAAGVAFVGLWTLAALVLAGLDRRDS